MKIGNIEKGNKAAEEQTPATDYSQVIVGIDIGTTTLSFVVADVQSKTVIKSYTILNESRMDAADSGFSEQNADRITDEIIRMAELLNESFPNILSIGITGQMHGVVCIDENGKAVTPLYTWQDERAGKIKEGSKTYCDEIKELTGNKVFSGYGHATLYYNVLNNILPRNARTYCTIMDYAAIRLADLKKPVIHSSNAASLGLYDFSEKAFDTEGIRKLGISQLEVPETTEENKIVGYFRNIPVAAAIGDNQASFYGSVKDEDKSILVNYGTGSQISLVSDTLCEVDGAEIRPYIGGKYLLCYSALCGGRAYAVLESFFSKYASEAGGSAASQYDVMNKLAERAYKADSKLKVSTLFCGTRENPDLRGSITLIDDKNFTPENLILGVLQGMVDELAGKFDGSKNSDITDLIASGNAVQKNTVLRNLLADTFNMSVKMTSQKEEAAFGAMLFGGVCAEKISMAEAKMFINYKED